MVELVASILAIGPLLSLLISVVNQPQWSARTRTIMSVAVSALGGIVTYVAESGLDFSSPSAIIAAVVGMILATSVAYRNIWKPTGVARAIEYTTSTKSLDKAEGIAHAENELDVITEEPADA